MPDTAQELADLCCWSSAFSYVPNLRHHGTHLHNGYLAASLACPHIMLIESEKSLVMILLCEDAILFSAIRNSLCIFSKKRQSEL